MELWKDSCCSRREASAKLDDDQERRHWTCEQIVCLKHCLSLKTFILNFVAFFVPLATVISCFLKMSFSVTSAKREFTPAGHCFIIHLPGGGRCPLVRDSEPIRLFVIPTSPSFVYANYDYWLNMLFTTENKASIRTTARYISLCFLLRDAASSN